MGLERPAPRVHEVHVQKSRGGRPGKLWGAPVAQLKLSSPLRNLNPFDHSATTCLSSGAIELITTGRDDSIRDAGP